jgi:hypothetical protein
MIWAAAALTLLVTALGPIPATGLAGHPAISAVDSMAGQLGVQTSTPPSDLPAPQVITGRPITAGEASALMGVSLSRPQPPEGFAPVSSLYYEGAAGGAFVSAFAGAGGSLTVYQARASGEDITAAAGSASSIALPDGTSAVFVDGAWSPAGEGLAWVPEGEQSLTFERAGVRVVITATGGEAGAASLVEVASRMQ